MVSYNNLPYIQPSLDMPVEIEEDPNRTITDESPVVDNCDRRPLQTYDQVNHRLHQRISQFREEFSYLSNLELNRRTRPIFFLAALSHQRVTGRPECFNEERIDRLASLCHGESRGLDRDGDWAAIASQGLKNFPNRSLEAELSHALKASWRLALAQSGDGRRGPSSNRGGPNLDRVRPSDTQSLLSARFSVPQRDPLATRLVTHSSLDFLVQELPAVDPGPNLKEQPWTRWMLSAGELLSADGASDLRLATTLHVIHANPLERKRICLPPSGDVIVAVTPTAYRRCHQSLFEMAQKQNRIRVLVVKEDDPSQVSQRQHTALFAAELLKNGYSVQRFHMMADNVKAVLGDAWMKVVEQNTMEIVTPRAPGLLAGPGDASLHLVAWHFPQREEGIRQLESVVQALRFMPRDFRGAVAVEHLYLNAAGMTFRRSDPKHFAWVAVNEHARAGSQGGNFFEMTFGNPDRRQAILDEIEQCQDLSPEQKSQLSHFYRGIFQKWLTSYKKNREATADRLSALGQSLVDLSRVDALRQKVGESKLRKALYEVMDGFTVSEEHRVLFVTAPCGVGKTLALSLLSADRKGRAAWFSFPTNQLASEFVKAAPLNLMSVHCQGELSGADLPKLRAHGAELVNATLVHPTLLSAVKADGASSRFEGLTIFVDEWHNLSDNQLKVLHTLLQKTAVKLVLLSATPRDTQYQDLKALFPGACREHVISVQSAIDEQLLRPRLYFDGTETSSRSKSGLKSLLRRTPFETRVERALTTLDASINGRPLWNWSGAIYLDNIKSAEALCAELRKKYPDLKVYNATGNQPDQPDFDVRPFLLVCCKRFKEGANIKALGYVMTLASLNDTDAIQIGGRLSRKSDRSDELPYGLFFAFGDGSHEKNSLRSDPMGVDHENFLQNCRAPDGENLTRYWPLMPAASDIFSPVQDRPNRIRINIGFLKDHTKHGEGNSIEFLTRKRHRIEEHTP